MAFVSPKMRRVIKGIFAALDEDGDGELNAAERSVVDDALGAGAGAGADAACAVRGADGLETYLCRWDGGAGPNAAATLKWILERVIDTWGAGDDRTLPLSFLEATLPAEDLAAFRAKPVPASSPPLPDGANLAYLTAFASHAPTALKLVRQRCTKEAAPEAVAPAPVEAEAEPEKSGEPSPHDGSASQTAAVAAEAAAEGAASPPHADGAGGGAEESPTVAPEAAAETEVAAEQSPVDAAGGAEGAGGTEAVVGGEATPPAGEVDAENGEPADATGQQQQQQEVVKENDAAAAATSAAVAEPTLQQLEAAALSRLRALRHARAMGHGSGRAASDSSSSSSDADSSTDSSESFSVCPDFPPPPLPAAVTAPAPAAAAPPATHHRALHEPRPSLARAATPADASGAPVRRSDGGGDVSGASLTDLQQEVAHLSRLRNALERVHVAAAAPQPQPPAHQQHPSSSLSPPVLVRRPLFPERGLSPPPQPSVAGQPLPWWPGGDTCAGYPAGQPAQVAAGGGSGGGDGLRTAAEWQKARGRGRPRASQQRPPDGGLRTAGYGAQQRQQQYSSGTHHSGVAKAFRSVPSSTVAAAAATLGSGLPSAGNVPGAGVYVPPRAGGGPFARRSGGGHLSYGKGGTREGCSSVHAAYVAAQATRRSAGGEFFVDT